jgi:cytosine/adenosine deaminase-related metal-dependent hydrolase
VSFVLSYLPNVEVVAQELYRVVRPGAHIFISDMHPETAARLNWNRSFRNADREVQLKSFNHSLGKAFDAFRSAGFEIRSLLEPAFGEHEKSLFEESGRINFYHAASELPAIYIGHLQKTTSASTAYIVSSSKDASLYISGARCAVGPEESGTATIAIKDEYVAWISSQPAIHKHAETYADKAVDLSGYMVLPGLINAHDHLEFGLFPNLGQGPYKNAAEWANDIHRTQSDIVATHHKVPKHIRCWWGGIRNLLSGVTTVCHHNPLMPEFTDEDFPVRVVSNFGWAHSIYFDDQVVRKARSTPEDFPFIIHAAEGTDKESADEIFLLDQMQALDRRTVLVHGLAISFDSIALLNERGASLIICPTSNQFLFNQLLDTEHLNAIKNVALGSDSPLTAIGDLLDELRFAHAEMELKPGELYRMVTTNPASILRLNRNEGRLVPDAVADMIAVRDTGATPAKTLSVLTSADIELVVLAGRIRLASSSIVRRLPIELQRRMQPFEVDGQIKWIQAPIHERLATTKEILKSDVVYVGGKKIGLVPGNEE